MAKLGMGEKFISLVIGLVKEETLRLHVNGALFEEIELEGVRQGCPLSPMLFAIAAKPLLSKFDHLLVVGKYIPISHAFCYCDPTSLIAL